MTVCSPSEYTIEYTLIDHCQSTRVVQESVTTSGVTVMLDDLVPGSKYEVSVRAMNIDNNPRQLTTEFITLASGKSYFFCGALITFHQYQRILPNTTYLLRQT